MGCKQAEAFIMQVIYPFKIFSAVDRPGHWVKRDRKFFLYFFKQIKTVLTIPVHFINKNNYRGFAHAAYLHQASCLLFYSINAVYNQYNAIHSCKGSECIFCKVLMARSI